MKEYKIIKQKAKLRNSDGDFEDELNSLAREGWIVKSSVAINGSSYFKVILERDKNR
ncbi:DUF4177 domain-containing protein [Cellulophaga sp. 20_2_10]|uniref:DUF4177 domain-containing protein n=1 Tax=Cellulophaga sp. 20_2_10 TaxID=2942476 RepID=UPI00201A6B69|nr:DUF4177 domain-containing protein [Cellulophaga sp. 20_2_10]MCL5247020.1 DUF4177 domain-containing protein [Cellulophaga sp. 20_2_10]